MLVQHVGHTNKNKSNMLVQHLENIIIIIIIIIIEYNYLYQEDFK